jgi:hypothetical protein
MMYKLTTYTLGLRRHILPVRVGKWSRVHFERTLVKVVKIKHRTRCIIDVECPVPGRRSAFLNRFWQL